MENTKKCNIFSLILRKMEEKMVEQKCLVNGKLLKKKSYQVKILTKYCTNVKCI